MVRDPDGILAQRQIRQGRLKGEGPVMVLRRSWQKLADGSQTRADDGLARLQPAIGAVSGSTSLRGPLRVRSRSESLI